MKLSNIQKDHLIEMIKNMYPKYLTVKLIAGTCDYCLENTILLSTEENPRHNNWKLVHWFEFCIYNLSYVIERKLDNNNSEINWINFISSEHPIDYLYSQYQKIN